MLTFFLGSFSGIMHNVKLELGRQNRYEFSCADRAVEGDQITGRSEQQRYALPGEPTCVICGKYGEYICNEVFIIYQSHLKSMMF